MLNNPDISLNKALDWVSTQNLKGFDPYDGSNSVLLGRILAPDGRGKFYAQQIFKRLPINLRPLFQIHKTYNPKALGLLLSVYSKLYVLNPFLSTGPDIISSINDTVEINNIAPNVI